MATSKTARRKRSRKRQALRKRGVPEEEVMRLVPIPGTTYAEWLDRMLAFKLAQEHDFDTTS